MSGCARRPASPPPPPPPPALPCDSPPQSQGMGPAAAMHASGLGFAAGEEPCRLLSPGEGLVPSPRARRGAPAGSYVNPSNHSTQPSTWAVGAAVGGEAAALPASLAAAGDFAGTLHCNPVFADALQHSQRVQNPRAHFSQASGCVGVQYAHRPGFASCMPFT